MSLDNVMCVSGKPGLYKLVTKTPQNYVLESLEHKRRLTVTIKSPVSILGQISVGRTAEVPLKDILKRIKEKEQGQQVTIELKNNKEALEAYFSEILSDDDHVDTIYENHMKKILQWYNILQTHHMLDELDSSSDSENPTNTTDISSPQEGA